MEEKIETDIDKGLRTSGIPGFTRFSIKAEDTEENIATHAGFKSFCEHETANNFTLGLRKLLENWQGNSQTDMLWEMIKEIKEEILFLKQEINQKDDKKKEEVAF